MTAATASPGYCEANGGLGVSPSNLVATWVGGMADGSGSLGGSVTGMNAEVGVCRNRATGQTIPITLAGASSWYCEAEGLVVSPSDFVVMGVRGIADSGSVSGLIRQPGSAPEQAYLTL